MNASLTTSTTGSNPSLACPAPGRTPFSLPPCLPPYPRANSLPRPGRRSSLGDAACPPSLPPSLPPALPPPLPPSSPTSPPVTAACPSERVCSPSRRLLVASDREPESPGSGLRTSLALPLPPALPPAHPPALVPLHSVLSLPIRARTAASERDEGRAEGTAGGREGGKRKQRGPMTRNGGGGKGGRERERTRRREGLKRCLGREDHHPSH
jgi:hypothetical protein